VEGVQDGASEESSTAADWPDLPLKAWEDTFATLHLWTQVVGKIRLARAPMIPRPRIRRDSGRLDHLEEVAHRWSGLDDPRRPLAAEQSQVRRRLFRQLQRGLFDIELYESLSLSLRSAIATSGIALPDSTAPRPPMPFAPRQCCMWRTSHGRRGQLIESHFRVRLIGEIGLHLGQVISGNLRSKKTR
jgi:Family of unknown function (DUF5996)